MKGPLHSVLVSWREAGRRTAFFLLLVLGSAAAGAVIAWPLWYFATSARGAYTAFALILVLAGIVFAVVKAIRRAGKAPRDGSARRRAPGAVLLGVLQAVVFLVGLYAAILLLSHGIWIFGVPVLVVWIGLLLLLGMARRAARKAAVR